MFVYSCCFFEIDQNCEPKIVAITIRSENWKDAYGNKESVEYKNLESKLLSAVSYFKCTWKMWVAVSIDGTTLHVQRL